jgi:hypothetical protein
MSDVVIRYRIIRDVKRYIMTVEDFFAFCQAIRDDIADAEKNKRIEDLNLFKESSFVEFVKSFNKNREEVATWADSLISSPYYGTKAAAYLLQYLKPALE